MDIVDKKIGTDVEAKLSQADGVLSVEVDLITPILVGKLSLGLQEAAIFDALEKKYTNPLVDSALELLKGAISKVG